MGKFFDVNEKEVLKISKFGPWKSLNFWSEKVYELLCQSWPLLPSLCPASPVASQPVAGPSFSAGTFYSTRPATCASIRVPPPQPRAPASPPPPPLTPRQPVREKGNIALKLQRKMLKIVEEVLQQQLMHCSLFMKIQILAIPSLLFLPLLRSG